jgi:hypothetical protein
VPNLPFGSGGASTFSFKGSPATRQPAFAAGHQARYPASYTGPTGWKDRRPRFPLSCCLSATGIRFLGVLFPPRDSASLAVGLPHHRPDEPADGMDLTGFPRSTRMRYDRVGCQLYPGSGGVHTTVEASSVAACRFSTARSSSSRHHNPTPGVAVTRHHRWFTLAHPFGLPLTCSTRSERAPLGFPRASHPAITGHARQGGDRSWTLTGVTSSTSSRTSNRRTTQGVRPRVATPIDR